MAKLLHANRANRRFSNVVRTWWALRSQRRRRQRNGEVSGGPPAAPGILSLEDKGGSVLVRWQSNSTDERGFRVYRVDAGVVGVVGPGAQEFQDYSVVGNHSYWYYVVAFNDAGESARTLMVGIDIPGSGG